MNANLGFMRKSLKYVVIGYVFLHSLSFVVAQPNPTIEEKPSLYRVKSGDTLHALLDRYVLSSNLLPELLQANPGINPDELRIGQILVIPRHLIRYTPSRAIVAYSKCASAIFLADSKKELKLGSVIVQGDVIQVPALCDMSLQFEDGSIVRMPSGGTIKVALLRKSPLEKSPEVQLSLQDGRVEVRVPKRQSGDAPFGVNTPNSVAGVRGTEFRVGFDSASGTGKVEVSSGVVATKGVMDIEEAGVTAQKGVLIPKMGFAGEVEDLPAPLTFLSSEPQQTPGWNLFVFRGSPNSKIYYLREDRQGSGARGQRWKSPKASKISRIQSVRSSRSCPKEGL